VLLFISSRRCWIFSCLTSRNIYWSFKNLSNDRFSPLLLVLGSNVHSWFSLLLITLDAAALLTYWMEDLRSVEVCLDYFKDKPLIILLERG
jgi:hypothetical protein